MKIYFIPLFLAASLSLASETEKIAIQLLQQGIELSIQQQYDQSLTLFESVKKSFPNHPAGYFFTAATLQTRMLDLETLIYQDQFYDEIDKTLDITEQAMLEHPEDHQLLFFYGAALSYKSYQLGREKKYLSAFKLGLKSIDKLQKVYETDSTFCDPLVGIGNYFYWTSKLTEIINWLPFVPDRKTEGIRLIKKAVDCSLFSRHAALSSLAWIQIKEENYIEAIEISKRGLKEVPSNFFKWPLAEALFKARRYQEANQYFNQILFNIQNSDEYNNHYNELIIFWKLAQCHAELGEKSMATNYCQKMINLKLEKEVRERGKDKQEKAQQLMNKLYQNW